MFQQLVNHNDDIKRLLEKGYALGFDSGCMIIRDIPYLDDHRELQFGAIVTKLEFIDKFHVIQTDHQIFFAGSIPHGLDGNPIRNLGGGSAQIPLSAAYEDVNVQRSFSNKPSKEGKFKDFFDKIESYVTIISGPAMELHDANPYTCRIDENMMNNSVFKFHDTLTSRAEIGDLSLKFKDEVIAIIGLGGTGSYVLDFMVKTPVREIRAFDGDFYHVHNAFRSSGRLNEDELGLSKATVYQDRYENFRHGLSIENVYIGSDNSESLKGVTFAFVCVDKGSARSEIFDVLISMGIPYIDVGMGLQREKNLSLKGMLRATYYSAENSRNIRGKGLAEEVDNPNDLYKSNIQISELNALNACLAVVQYKQIVGFYSNKNSYHHMLFNIANFKLAGDGCEN